MIDRDTKMLQENLARVFQKLAQDQGESFDDPPSARDPHEGDRGEAWAARQDANDPLEKLKRDVIEVVEDLAEGHDYDEPSGGFSRAQLEAVEQIRAEINKTLDEFEDKLHIDPSS